jgi:hypothetical protein
MDYRNVVIFRNSSVFMKKFLFLLFCVSFTGYGQSVQLSEQATISVITCGPWQGELYSAFGHSAFRVHDPAQGIDEAYNYGVFDFDQPNFYLNFARGYMYYKLGVYDYNRFRDIYIYYNRYIHEQVLNLTQEQKQKKTKITDTIISTITVLPKCRALYRARLATVLCLTDRI